MATLVVASPGRFLTREGIYLPGGFNISKRILFIQPRKKYNSIKVHYRIRNGRRVIEA
ncbi:MAG: hypothetical protein HOD90_08855 [Nitrospina sp.]|nr:hypothetical protein [Nitrospina sp.]